MYEVNAGEKKGRISETNFNLRLIFNGKRRLVFEDYAKFYSDIWSARGKRRLRGQSYNLENGRD